MHTLIKQTIADQTKVYVEHACKNGVYRITLYKKPSFYLKETYVLSYTDNNCSTIIIKASHRREFLIEIEQAIILEKIFIPKEFNLDEILDSIEIELFGQPLKF